jgi:hypothetical protein
MCSEIWKFPAEYEQDSPQTDLHQVGSHRVRDRAGYDRNVDPEAGAGSAQASFTPNVVDRGS